MRVFDVYNEKDKEDLFDILPDRIESISNVDYNNMNGVYPNSIQLCNDGTIIPYGLIQIDWKDMNVIYRPIREASGNDCGKLCYMWQDKHHACYGVLKNIIYDNGVKKYVRNDGTYFYHCRRLTKEEKETLL